MFEILSMIWLSLPMMIMLAETSPFSLIFFFLSLIFCGASLMNFYTMSWMVYSFILLFMGGILIIFAYIGSLTHKEKAIYKNNYIFLSLMFIILSLWFSFSNSIPFPMLHKVNLFAIYMDGGYSSLVVMTTILILSMLSIVKLVAISKGALKMKI